MRLPNAPAKLKKSEKPTVPFPSKSGVTATVVVSVAVPVRETIWVPRSGSLLNICSVPVCLPPDVGAKMTLAVSVAPAATDSVVCDTEKGAWVTKPVMESVWLPVLVMLKVYITPRLISFLVWVWVFPVDTSAQERDVVASAITGRAVTTEMGLNRPKKGRLCPLVPPYMIISYWPT